MSYNLFLDDTRTPKDVTWIDLPKVHWEIAKSFSDFVFLIKTKGIPDLVSYDCDLCQEHYDNYFALRHTYPIHYHEFKTPCGIHCIEYLLRVCSVLKERPHPPYFIHTMNNYAGPFMDNLIKDYNKRIFKYSKLTPM